MELSLYSAIQRGERSWWYRGRTQAVRAVLKLVSLSHGRVLDVGAGYGAMYPLLSRYGKVDAVEMHIDCHSFLQKRAYSRVYTLLDDIAEGIHYDLIGAFDVIEHIENDVQAVQSIYSHLRNDGLLVLTVPAHMYLWSQHDVLNKHIRRYEPLEVKLLLERAGFTVEYLGYWNMLLLIPTRVLRFFGKGGGDALVLHPIINTMLSLLLSFEALLLRYIHLPFGVSIVAVARKNR